jgi:hypothetical protein
MTEEQARRILAAKAAEQDMARQRSIAAQANERQASPTAARASRDGIDRSGADAGIKRRD